MGGEGKAFFLPWFAGEEGPWVPRGSLAPPGPPTSKKSVSLVPGHGWAGTEIGLVGGGEGHPLAMCQCLSPLDGPCHPARTPLVRRCRARPSGASLAPAQTSRRIGGTGMLCQGLPWARWVPHTPHDLGSIQGAKCHLGPCPPPL